MGALRSGTGRSIVRHGLIAAGYLLAFSLLDWLAGFFANPAGISPWYLPASLRLLLVLLAGRRYAPWIWVGLLLAGLQRPSALGPLLLAQVGVVITLGYLASAIWLRRWLSADLAIRSLADMGRCLLAMAVPVGGVAAGAPVFFILAGSMPASAYLANVRDWWIGDMISLVSFVPFVLIMRMEWPARWAAPRPPPLNSRALIDATAQIVLGLSVLWLVFGSPDSPALYRLYLLFLPLVWAGLRFGLPGAVSAVLGLNAVAVLASSLFANLPIPLAELQLFMLALSVTGLLLGAAVTERATVTSALQSSEERFAKAFHSSPTGYSISRMGDGRLVDVNDSWVQASGYSRETLMEKGIIGLDIWADPADRARLLDLVRAQQRVRDFPTCLRHMSGELREYIMGAEIIEIQGEPHLLISGHDITDLRQATLALQRVNDDLIAAYDTTLEGWARALDLRDHETEDHCRRVTELTLRLAQAAGLAGEDLLYIRWGALLHDIGKIAVPDAILNKPGPLTAEEWAVMRRHPEYAYNLLSPIPFLRPALAIPYCHHERWDGTGYPRGLRGGEIPQAARLFAVVDVWDALRSDRAYRPALPRDEVIAHLRTDAGSHFDPEIVPVFLDLLAAGELDALLAGTATAEDQRASP